MVKNIVASHDREAAWAYRGASMQTDPIIVVGASRSGTSLIRSCLNQHSNIHLAGETHYFDDLRLRMREGAMDPLSSDQRRVAEDYFLSLAHRPYGHGGDPEKSPVSRGELKARAETLGVGPDAYFEAFCHIMADKNGKPEGRWGEKTPRHVFRIPEILQRYPGAQIICAVRDPRAVVSSYRDWRHQGGFDLDGDPDHKTALEAEEVRTGRSYDLRLATLLWRSTIGAATAARAQFGDERILVQRYEDMVLRPEESMREMAAWLGLEFEPEMMDVPIHNSSFSRFDAHGGVSSEPLRRWESKLTGSEVATIQFLGGKAMQSQGYEALDVPASKLSIAAGLVTLPVAAARAATANRQRIGSLPGYVWRRARTVVSSRI
ncbi:sulfotransferase family protein [Phytoactinopolyspora endophytica]|uniref:sulfotransferase family protein n=1 Tax=Phytoactinopolyspora endophytica TaxID=1642495 RepID=UPI0013ED9B12|nr:sulfotransferase [Phytoactinopolyspora endophytica]